VFGRIVWKMLRGGKGRIFVALLAVTSGAAVISALLNVQFDMQHKLTEQFRTLGPNVVVAAKSGDQSVDLRVVQTSAAVNVPPALHTGNPLADPEVSAAAPFFYSVVHVAGVPVIGVGTWLEELPRLNPTWRIDGTWITSRDENSRCLIGRGVARQFQIAPGGTISLDYGQNHTSFRVAGVIDSGSSEDNQIFLSLPGAWDLTGEHDFATLWQLNVSGTGAAIEHYVARLATAFPQYDVRPIRAVTEAEGNLLHRTRLLIASMVALILVLTALCVLATMAALAMERREDVGLMKALGGSIARIVGLFLAEVGVLGAAGGLIGCVIGIVLAQWMGQRVFDTSITPRWEIFPLTIAMMVAVALAGALPLRLLGKVKPAVILRGE